MSAKNAIKTIHIVNLSKITQVSANPENFPSFSVQTAETAELDVLGQIGLLKNHLRPQYRFSVVHHRKHRNRRRQAESLSRLWVLTQLALLG